MSEIPPNLPDDDQQASDWQEVYRACEAGLRAFLRGRLSQQVDVEDCLQAVCVKMLQSGQNVAPAARRAWLFRVAANEAASLWRRKATTDRVLERQAEHRQAEQTGAETEHDAADRVILNETTTQLRQAVQRLPESWQQVVRLRMNENLTFQQIADQLGIPLGTALTQMRRALERLRSEIESEHES
jgi:RNA polymerase sigma-70 factor (ECF subfamily)